MKIPKRFVLPGKYVVTVKLLPRTVMLQEHEDTDGCWDVDTHTIYIGKHLRKHMKDYVFRHELLHAALDWALKHDYQVNGWDEDEN